MPDFEKIRLGAPVKAEFEFRGELKRVEVDGEFEVVVPTVTVADTTLVATLELDRKRLEYRLIEGRLFRPFVQFDMHTWTLDELRKCRPPTVNAQPIRTLKYFRETPLLASPWLSWEPKLEETTDAMRARVRRLAPREWDDVGRILQNVAERGLRLVDGNLFHETHAPVLGFAPPREALKPWMPDAHEGFPSLLFDPRIAPTDFEEIARRIGTRLEANSLQIHEPSLLPNTVESNAIAAFALWAYDKVCGNEVGTYDVHRLADVLSLVGAAERMVLQQLAPDECWAQIGRIARRDEDRAGIHQRDRETTVKIARQAALLMDMRQRFPAPTTAPPPDADDGEDIARAFTP